MKESMSRRSRDSNVMTSTDPMSMLKEDHTNVKKLFDQFEKTDDEQTQMELARRAINELKVHAAIEEEIFYPAVQDMVDDEEIMCEATEEHHVAHLLIDELDGEDLDHETFHAKFVVLAENVRHHIKEEEGEMFPKINKKENDLDQIGARMAERKQQLMENPDSMGQTSTRQKSSVKTSRTAKASRQNGTRKAARGSSKSPSPRASR